MHKGIGLLIANKDDTLFFVQQKDQNYLPEKWRGAFSFWGGEVELEDKSFEFALKRELEEEIDYIIDFKINTIKLIGKYKIKSDEEFIFYLYKINLGDNEFIQICNSKIKEGLGLVANKEQLQTQNWVWGLEQVLIQIFD